MTLKFRGFPACACLVEWLPVFEAELLRRKVIKYGLDIFQLIGGAPKSGGTHATGGAYDVGQRDAVSIKVGREMGAAFWNRPFNWDNARGMAHAHGVLNKCPHNKPGRYQIADLAKGLSGLANHGRDTGPLPRKLRSFNAGIQWAANQIPVTKGPRKWTVAKASTASRVYPGVGPVKATRKHGHKLTTTGLYKRHDGVLFARTRFGSFYDTRDLLDAAAIVPKPVPVPPKSVPAEDVTATIRAMTFNFPGADKLPDPIGRCAAGVEAIKSGTPDLVGLNELVGPGKDGGPASPFAKSVHAGMGAGWTLIVPTTAWNENYALIRDAKATVVKQYDDVKVYAKVGTRTIPGRHVTPLVVKDKATGVVIALGVTHLVSDDVPGAQAQSVIVMAAMAEVSKKHGNCPVVIVGDMNMSESPIGFVAGGLGNCAVTAKASTTRGLDTFASYAKTKPANLGAKAYDQIWVTAKAIVNGYNVLAGTDANGTFPLLRPSDHVPVIVSVTFKK